MSFTKGNWEVGFKGWEESPVVCVGKFAGIIAEMKHPPGNDGDMKSNAHLIAAAPDMYEALKAMHKALFLADDPIDEATIIREFEAMGKALAKADGK